MRLPVPQGFSHWWDEEPFGAAPLALALHWRGDARLEIGRLRPDRGALRFEPDDPDFTGDGAHAERPGRLVAKALTRAGWLRPRLDPAALLRLIELRSAPGRVEFILDTNAMVEGIGHWLADHFADRCALVVTAVSLRELQDQHGQARFGAPIPRARPGNPKGDGSARGDLLGARQLYLAAHRFREQTGYERMVWRELPLDDTALLLSRGRSKAKSSESDTLLLRAVRRSIHARVNNLERLFVTGDTALARRAATELPRHSVIAARVQELRPGDVLFPSAWWPGADHGYRVARHASRVIWELLCIGDSVSLTSDDGRTWRFSAFADPMWPSDYLNPWIDVESPAPSPAPSPARNAEVPDPPARRPGPSPATATPIWRPLEPVSEPLDHNLRPGAARILDVLAALVTGRDGAVRLPAEITSRQLRGHVRLLLGALGLAEVDRDTWTARPGRRHAELVAAWCADDHDAVFDLLRGWVPLEQWATLDEPPKLPAATAGTARALAALLGQGMYVEGRWQPGGRRPSTAEIRLAVTDGALERPHRAIPVYTLLVDVFLRRLGVGPVRVARAWDRLWRAGVFEGFEAREGGSSSGRHLQEVAVLSAGGWEAEPIDLEACGGVRDLVYRGPS